jgi:high-affinity nickel-transport protein
MSDAALRSPTVNVFRRMVRSWNRRDWWQFGALATAILVLHLVGFGTLFVLIAPHHYQVGTRSSASDWV